jgi:hypothetical protein
MRDTQMNTQILTQRTFLGRIFKLWEYHVSHGSLLIRSPKSLDEATNILISKMLQPSEAKPLGEAQRRWRQRSGAWEACRAGTDG